MKGEIKMIEKFKRRSKAIKGIEERIEVLTNELNRIDLEVEQRDELIEELKSLTKIRDDFRGAA